MLISLSHKFIFIANPKTASTAIEKMLRPFADLALVESRFGKHQSLAEVEARFEWLLDPIGRQDFFVFGVMRDPIDFMISLYNSHMDPKFEEQAALYTGGLDFDRFLDEWTVINHDQCRPQHDRLLDTEGRIGADYIVSYPNLVEGLRFVGRCIGVDDLPELGRENASYGCFDRSSLSDAQRDRITARFALDQMVMENYCDHLLSGGFMSIPPKRDLLTERSDQICYQNGHDGS